MLKHKDINKLNYDYLSKMTAEDEINRMYESVLKNDKFFYLPLTYNNMGTRYRNNISFLNDVPNKAGNNSITFSGYTGPSFTIDFDNEVIVIIMCNVMHNTTLNRKERKQKSVEIMNNIFYNLHNS